MKAKIIPLYQLTVNCATGNGGRKTNTIPDHSKRNYQTRASGQTSSETPRRPPGLKTQLGGTTGKSQRERYKAHGCIQDSASIGTQWQSHGCAMQPTSATNPPHKRDTEARKKGTVKLTKQFESIQRQASISSEQ